MSAEPVFGIVEATPLVFTPLEAFAAVDEPGVEPLARATAGGTLIPSNGLIIVYGDGGAGKTTLVIDLAFKLAAGESWLDLVAPARPLRVAIIENEGPRQEFRDKLERKLAAHSDLDLDGRVVVLEEPWADFTFADEQRRRTLADAIDELAIDLLIVGPITSVGMEGGGTPDEIRRFEQLLQNVRALVDRPFAVALLHHENRAGQISGAWERVPDTLVHVSAQGHGHTRVFWQKARWSSALHGTTTHLLWADGESFTVENKPEIDDDTLAEQIISFIGENAGTGWTAVEKATPGVGKEKRRAVRDRLFVANQILNIASSDDGNEVALDHCPERQRARLYLADDPAVRHLRPASGAALAQAAPPLGEGDQLRLRRAPRPVRGAGVGAAQASPVQGQEVELEWR